MNFYFSNLFYDVRDSRNKFAVSEKNTYSFLDSPRFDDVSILYKKLAAFGQKMYCLPASSMIAVLKKF